MRRRSPKVNPGPVTLEEQILDLLRAKPMKTQDIRVVLGRELTDYNDDLGRAMQRLRIKGVIRHDKPFGLWMLTNRRKCPRCDGSGFVDE